MNAMHQAITNLDVPALRAMGQGDGRSDADMLTMAHMARTAAANVDMRLRRYSDRWLTDRGLPSRLPPAERPIKVPVVGYANAGDGYVVQEVRKVVSYAVMDCFANGDYEPGVVHTQMMRARLRERKALGRPAFKDVPLAWV